MQTRVLTKPLSNAVGRSALRRSALPPGAGCRSAVLHVTTKFIEGLGGQLEPEVRAFDVAARRQVGGEQRLRYRRDPFPREFSWIERLHRPYHRSPGPA